MSWFRVGAIVAVTALAAAPAAAGEWEKLGERQVAFSADRDVIPVGARVPYVKLKLVVQDRPIEVLDLKIHFGNGEVKDVAVRARIAAGGETRAIDLPGERRLIERVTLVYRTEGRRRKGKAHVVVFGKRGDEAAPAEREQARPVWVSLGSRRVALFGADRDTIPVTGAQGTFRRIKLRVSENKLFLMNLEVHFANGTVAKLPWKAEIAAGAETPPIDLPGAVRTIRKVVLVYRTGRKKRAGRAQVELFGLQEAAQAAPEPAKQQPQAGEWERLGERVVKKRAEQDTIEVTAREGRFTALKLLIREAAVEMIDMKVHFGNGETQDVPLRATIRAGGESRVIDLSGGGRVISRVVFRYRTLDPRGARARVVLFGRH